MSSVLIIDQGGCGLAMAYRMAEQGDTVYLFIEPKDSNDQDAGKGMHPNIIKVKEWLPLAMKVDLITCTENGNYLPKLDAIRKKSQNVFCPSQKFADLEIKRGDGLKFCEDHGLKVPEYKTFKSIKEAEQYVIDNPEQYVFKTLGDNDDKALTYVGKTAKQMVQQLRMWQEEGVSIKGEVMLQKFVKGIEFGCSRWIGKNGFFGPVEETFNTTLLASINVNLTS